MSLEPHDGMSDQERELALSPDFGAGSPDTAPREDPAVGWLRSQPVVAFAVALLLPAVGAIVEALVAGAPVRAALIAGGSALAAAGLALVRRSVTPVADPKLEDGLRLTVE